MRGVSNRVSPLFWLLVAVAVAGGVLTAVAPLSPGPVGDNALFIAGVFVLVLAGWAVSLCLHEFGHAIVAYRAGDHSVAARGYLTLDIRRYTDPMLSLVLPIGILLLGGLPLPGGAVWIQHSAFRFRRTRSLVSLAGPAMNLALGGALLVVLATVPVMPVGLYWGLSTLAFFQILAFVLNMLPVPGLDGFGVLEPYLPPAAQRLGATLRPWAPFILLALIIGVPAVGQTIFGLSWWAFDALGGDTQAAEIGRSLLRFW